MSQSKTTTLRRSKPQKPPTLHWGQYYHIYNRGVNRENIFIEERNYNYFLALYARHIYPIAHTFAYCLLANHFHFLVQLKEADEIRNRKDASQYFSNFFNAYAKTINKNYGRTGSLFQRPFGRILVENDAYFTRLILYIHQNPQKHGFVDDFRVWPFSSYQAISGTQGTKLDRENVLDWFGGIDAFQASHVVELEMENFSHLIGED